MRFIDIYESITLKMVNISRDAKNNTISVVGMTTDMKRIVIKTWHENSSEEAYTLLNNIKTGKNLEYYILQEKKEKPLSTMGAWNKAEDPKYNRNNPPDTDNKGVSARKGFVGG